MATTETAPDTEAWLDYSLGYQTVRTSYADQDAHCQAATRYLAALVGVEIGSMPESEEPNHVRAAAALCTAGVKAKATSTWTADGIYVTGVQLGDDFYVIV